MAFQFLFLLLFVSVFVQPSSRAAEDYYGSLSGLKGAPLKEALHQIIRQSERLNYNQVFFYLKTIDQDPSNAERTIMVYSQRSLPSSSVGGSDSDAGWNREHVWPSSRGFSRRDMPAHTDLHNLRPCEVSINRLHADLMFGAAPDGQEVAEAPGTRFDSEVWEPNDAMKGDIARILFYMDVRYQGDSPKESDLRLVERLASLSGRDEAGNGYLANLSTLLRWHRDDPVDARERLRNERVYAIQKNRNPFVDHPEFAAAIYEPQ